MTGDATTVLNQQIFAWEANKRGVDVHPQAMPTQLELMNKEVERRKEAVQERQRQSFVSFLPLFFLFFLLIVFFFMTRASVHRRSMFTLPTLFLAVLLERYGGSEHLETAPPELLMAQSEVFIEYGPDGRPVSETTRKLKKGSLIRSKYEEDGNFSLFFWSLVFAVS